MKNTLFDELCQVDKQFLLNDNGILNNNFNGITELKSIPFVDVVTKKWMSNEIGKTGSAPLLLKNRESFCAYILKSIKEGIPLYIDPFKKDAQFLQKGSYTNTTYHHELTTTRLVTFDIDKNISLPSRVDGFSFDEQLLAFKQELAKKGISVNIAFASIRTDGKAIQFGIALNKHVHFFQSQNIRKTLNSKLIDKGFSIDTGYNGHKFRGVTSFRETNVKKDNASKAMLYICKYFKNDYSLEELKAIFQLNEDEFKFCNDNQPLKKELSATQRTVLKLREKTKPEELAIFNDIVRKIKNEFIYLKQKQYQQLKKNGFYLDKKGEKQTGLNINRSFVLFCSDIIGWAYRNYEFIAYPAFTDWLESKGQNDIYEDIIFSEREKGVLLFGEKSSGNAEDEFFRCFQQGYKNCNDIKKSISDAKASVKKHSLKPNIVNNEKDGNEENQAIIEFFNNKMSQLTNSFSEDFKRDYLKCLNTQFDMLMKKHPLVDWPLKLSGLAKYVYCKQTRLYYEVLDGIYSCSYGNYGKITRCVAIPESEFVSRNVDLFQNITHSIDKKGELKKKDTGLSSSEYAFKHVSVSNILTHVDEVTCRNTKDVLIFEEGKLKINIQPIPRFPSSSFGDVQPFLSLVTHVFNDKTDLQGKPLANTFIEWLAYVCSHPRPTNWHWMVLSSFEGIGKSLLSSVFSILLSTAFKTITCDSLKSNFNSVFSNATLLCIDDVDKSGGDSSTMLKSVLANDTIEIRLKGKESYITDRTFSLIWFANTIDAHRILKVSENNRRWCYVVTDAKPRESLYYTNFVDWRKKSENISALKDYLAAIYKSFSPEKLASFSGRAPETLDKNHQAFSADFFSMSMLDAFSDCVVTLDNNAMFVVMDEILIKLSSEFNEISMSKIKFANVVDSFLSNKLFSPLLDSTGQSFRFSINSSRVRKKVYVNAQAKSLNLDYLKCEISSHLSGVKKDNRENTIAKVINLKEEKENEIDALFQNFVQPTDRGNEKNGTN